MIPRRSNAPAARSARTTIRAVLHYLAQQVPGWLLGGLVIVLARELIGFDAPTAWLLLGAWVAKDFVVLPFIWPGTVTGTPTAPRELIGTSGVALENLAPAGYVRIGGELWKAEALECDRPLPSGTLVRVVDARGLTLLVAELREPPH